MAFALREVMHTAPSSSNSRLDIAVMDRNPNVREFLCRELSVLGFAVGALPNSGSLLLALRCPRPPRVVVFDPEAAGASLAEVVHDLREHSGQVAVVLHVFEGEEPLPELPDAVLVEKRPDMRTLKAALAAITGKAAVGPERGDEA